MRLELLNLGPSCDQNFIATVPDSVRATFFVFSCISGTFETFASLRLGDDEEEASLQMHSWPTAATWTKPK